MSKEKIMRSDKAKDWRISSEGSLPLELTKENHICLWSADETYKWTIGYFELEGEGPRFKFVGERPMDARVDWEKFRELIKLGYALAWHKFNCEQDKRSI
jgi:hypothetical protein